MNEFPPPKPSSFRARLEAHRGAYQSRTGPTRGMGPLPGVAERTNERVPA